MRWAWSFVFAIALSFVPATLAAREIDAPALIEAPIFRLQVPFRTQKDGSRWQSSNCGPAALGMALDGFGLVGQSTDDLRFRSHSYQGTVGMRTGTALQHIAQVAHDLGLPTTGLYDASGQFRAWRMDDIRGQLRLGRPVMALVRLYLIPGHETAATRWGHYILLTGITEDGFFYHDPLKPNALEGEARTIPASQLERAMYASLHPGQAVAFGGPSLTPLSVWTPGHESAVSTPMPRAACDADPRALRPYLFGPTLCYA